MGDMASSYLHVNNSLFKISLGSTLAMLGCQQNEEKGRVETTA